MNAGGLLLRERVCRGGSAFGPATGFFVMGANQIVVRNSQGPLRSTVRREESEGRGPERGGGGEPTGALSHDDIVKRIRPGLHVTAHTFVSGHSLPPSTYSTNPTQGLWSLRSMGGEGNQRV